MKSNDFWTRLAIGAAAGLAGTMALQAARTANKKWLPQAQAPMRQDPAEFMINAAERVLPAEQRERIPEKVEALAGRLLATGYGMTFGALFGALRSNIKSLLLEGALLGLATWAVGYLGWLPGTKLMPPVWRQKPKQVITPIAEHALYGVATVAGLRQLKERFAAGRG